MTTKSVAVLVILRTDDARLDPDKIDVSTARKVAELRRAVVENLPQLERVVLVMEEEMARMMMSAHDAAVAMLGGDVRRPPPDYVPPTRD